MLPEVPAGQAMADRGLNLPSGYHVGKSDVDRVATQLERILTG